MDRVIWMCVCISVHYILVLETFSFLCPGKALLGRATHHYRHPEDLPVTLPKVVPLPGYPSRYLHGKYLPKPKGYISCCSMSPTAADTAQSSRIAIHHLLCA